MEVVGGQAVIEGVMMRAKGSVVTAVRDPHGRIVFRKGKVSSLTKKAPFKWPFLRGVISLCETLVIGLKSLNYSADVAMHDGKKVESTKKDWVFMAFSVVLSFALAIAIFKFIPLALAQFAAGFSSVFGNRFVFNVIEGVLKLGMFVGYIFVIGRMKDMRRVFQYHGAEHKAVNCYEAGKSLTIDNAKVFSTVNPRCGTSFLLFVILVSILVYVVIPLDFSFWVKLGLRILLLPVIAGVSYEILKLSARYPRNSFFLAVSAPGLWMQMLTAKEPDDRQLEVALFSLRKALKD